jgi:hypothetical protein
MDVMEQKWTYGLWGLAIGAILCASVGMKWGGWETRHSAQVMAQEKVNVALVKALTPICVAKFQAASNAPAQLDELKKINSTWARETFVREGKWADIGNELNRPVIDACADALYKL